MVTHSSILAWRILWTEEPKGYSLQGRKELDPNIHKLSDLTQFNTNSFTMTLCKLHCYFSREKANLTEWNFKYFGGL